ncbi:MAG: SDR family oxidoreductase [Actinobacteria bacterium]|nr:SDR family oxidoreductase [Actinomycetota bacterium]
MAVYLVTGATGFLGGQLVERLLARPNAEVHALVRPGSQSKLAAKMRRWPMGHRVAPLLGDLSAPGLGLEPSAVERLTGRVDHLVHLAALYDMTADDATNEAVNVEGTRHVVDLANRLGVGCLHHVSSVAVAGHFQGVYREDMFDEGQELPSPYHRTKFEAERAVRTEATVPWRVYRPAVVVGHSVTGEIDKVDGPYYLFEAIRRLAALPSWVRIAAPDIGATNVVPVDFVADAMDHLLHRPGLDGQAFHLCSPRPQRVTAVFNAFAAAAGAPRIVPLLPRATVRPAARVGGLLARLPGAELLTDVALDQVGIPREILPHFSFPSVFDTTATQAALEGSEIEVPDLRRYAPVLWRYWEEHLDRDRARRHRPGGPLAGRRVVITGASSGIGRATAVHVARRGGVPLLVARRTEALEEVKAEIERAGGQAWVYSCDITQPESVETLVKQLLHDHEGIDMLVNNAGRSIRRSIRLSYDRFHDFERTMSINYFGAVRLILGLLPHMTDRRFGHIVNISSIGVQANPPRFSAYVASKAALDAFTRIVGTETYGDGITFTTIHMPLVRTPMISPTKLYDAFPTATPDEAAEMVVRALIERPNHINTRLGTFGEVAYALAPKAVDQLLHVAFRVFPDSAAARGHDDPEAHDGSALSRAADALVRLLPGVHW